MAVGDVTCDLQSIANGSYLDIQPGSGVEWVIHNITFAGASELHYYDGSNDITADTSAGAGMLANMALHCTNSKRYRVKNTSGGSIYISYDGVITK